MTVRWQISPGDLVYFVRSDCTHSNGLIHSVLDSGLVIVKTFDDDSNTLPLDQIHYLGQFVPEYNPASAAFINWWYLKPDPLWNAYSLLQGAQ